LVEEALEELYAAQHALEPLERVDKVIGLVEGLDAAFKVKIIGEAAACRDEVTGGPCVVIRLDQFSRAHLRPPVLWVGSN
jgi:hypothetical protein